MTYRLAPLYRNTKSDTYENNCNNKSENRCKIVNKNKECIKYIRGPRGPQKEGGITAERLISFLDKFINNKMKKHLIIMDNAGAHRNKIIKKYINDIGNKLHYSIPYKPKKNAIETWLVNLNTI